MLNKVKQDLDLAIIKRLRDDGIVRASNNDEDRQAVKSSE
jgi:hypothetical protein